MPPGNRRQQIALLAKAHARADAQKETPLDLVKKVGFLPANAITIAKRRQAIDAANRMQTASLTPGPPLTGSLRPGPKPPPTKATSIGFADVSQLEPDAKYQASHQRAPSFNLPGQHLFGKAASQIGEGLVNSPGFGIELGQAFGNDIRDPYGHHILGLLSQVGKQSAASLRHPGRDPGIALMTAASLAMPFLRAGAAGGLSAAEGADAATVARAALRPGRRPVPDRTISYAGSGNVPINYSRGPIGEIGQRLYDRALGLKPGQEQVPASPFLQRLAERRIAREQAANADILNPSHLTVDERAALRAQPGPDILTPNQRAQAQARAHRPARGGTIKTVEQKLAEQRAAQQALTEQSMRFPGTESLIQQDIARRHAPGEPPPPFAPGHGEPGPGQLSIPGLGATPEVRPHRYTVPARAGEPVPGQQSIYGREVRPGDIARKRTVMQRAADVGSQLTTGGIFFAKGPGYVIPNVLGNETLSAVDQGLGRVGAMRGYQRARKALEKTPEGKVALDRLRVAGGSGASEGLIVRPTDNTSFLEQKLAAAHERMAHGYGKVIDQRNRGEAIIYHAAQKGYSTPEDLIHLATNPAAEADLIRIARRARESLGDFTLNKFEREKARRIIFIYPWLKASVKIARHYIDTHPYFFAGSVLAGEQARGQAQKTLGHVPSYAEGIYPVGSTRVPGVGRVPLVVNPQSSAFLNTLPQVIGAARSLVKGGGSAADEPIGFINPIWASGITALTGVDPQTQHAIPRYRSRVGEALGSYVSSFPAVLAGKRIERALNNPSQVSKYLYPFSGTSIGGGKINATPQGLANAVTSYAALQNYLGGIAPKPYNPVAGETRYRADVTSALSPQKAVPFRWRYTRQDLAKAFGGTLPPDVASATQMLELRDQTLANATAAAGHKLSPAERYGAIAALMMPAAQAQAAAKFIDKLPPSQQSKALSALNSSIFGNASALVSNLQTQLKDIKAAQAQP